MSTPNPVPVVTSPAGVQVADIDQDPRDWQGNAVTTTDADFDAALRVITDAVDDARCHSCGTAIGYVLVDDDTGRSMSGHWRGVWLVRHPGQPVHAYCEDCADLAIVPREHRGSHGGFD